MSLFVGGLIILNDQAVSTLAAVASCAAVLTAPYTLLGQRGVARPRHDPEMLGDGGC
jgi:hypothetical protein